MPEDCDGHSVPAVPVSRDGVPAVADLLAEVASLRAERAALQEHVASNAANMDNLKQVRDDFIAAASHDLKSPLTAILGGAQYIERVLGAPHPEVNKARKWARVIQSQGRMMTLLINDLLDASRIQTGAFDIRPAPSEMNQCVATAISRLGPDGHERVMATFAPHPVNGSWDRQRIEQVISNLLDNALKYSPYREPIAIEVETRGGEVEVSVSDRGVGIPATELPHLFTRFYRAATATATSGEVTGVGLGLYICEQIITAHGGRLWAESAGPNEGSSFRFTIPIHSGVPASTAHYQEEQSV